MRVLLDRQQLLAPVCPAQDKAIAGLLGRGAKVGIWRTPANYGSQHVKCFIVDEHTYLGGSLNCTLPGMEFNNDLPVSNITPADPFPLRPRYSKHIQNVAASKTGTDPAPLA